MNDNVLVITLLCGFALVLIVLLILLFVINRLNSKLDNNQKEDNITILETKLTNTLLNETDKIKDGLNGTFQRLNEITNNNLNNFKQDINTVVINQNKTLEEFKKAFYENEKAQTNSLNIFKNESKDEIRNSYTSLLELVTNQLKEINNKVDEKLSLGFKENKDSLSKVAESLGRISEAQKHLDSLSSEVTSLNNILNNSQKRGRFGEVVLESILNEVFGETHNTYDTQYVIKENNKRPDAVIFLPNEKILCIDSKFSFVSYEKLFDTRGDINSEERSNLLKDLKNQLKAEIKKISEDYILNSVTINYAIMFIPNDGIYSFIQSNEDLYEGCVPYARKLNVIITSPSTLQPILANLRMLKIQFEISQNISNVVKEIDNLRKENEKFNVRWETFSNSLDKAVKTKDEFSKSVKTFSKKADDIVSRAKGENLVIEENSQD